MNRTKRVVSAIVLSAAMVFGLSACSTVNTAPDAVALHYSGGMFESQEFVACVPASTRQVNGPGEHYYYYPVGQRTFSFTGKESGGESDPIKTNTKDSQQVSVSGFVTFELNVAIEEDEDGKMDCKQLREFHERIGYKSKAYFEGNPDFAEINVEGDEKNRQTGDNQEWRDFLSQYLKTPLDMVMDDNGQKFGWRELFQDQNAQNEFKSGVAEDLPNAVNTALGSSEFFSVLDVVISTPLPDQGLLDALKDTEVAKESNNAQKERNAVAKTKYDSIKECKEAGISETSCLALRALEEDKVPFYILPDGQSIQVTGGSAPAPAPTEE